MEEKYVFGMKSLLSSYKMSGMKYFHNPFLKKTTCERCAKIYDPVYENCPECGEPNPQFNPSYRSFEHTQPLGWVRELILLAFGTILLFAVAQIIGGVAVFVKTAELAGQSLSQEEIKAALEAYLESTELSLWMNDLTYLLIFGAMLLFLWKQNRLIWKSFANLRALYGVVFGVVILVLSTIWGLIAKQLGATPNTNESIVKDGVLSAPVLAILVTGIIAPFVEEMTYRVAGFGFLKRFNRVVAYLVIGALFGLIHIKNYASLNEWLSYPSYLIAGFSLCFVYERFGFGAAFIAHSINNLTVVILYLAGAN